MMLPTPASYDFNPLPPDGGRHFAYCIFLSYQLLFQSTPSGRRETDTPFYMVWIVFNFNPLPPDGGRLDSKINDMLQ